MSRSIASGRGQRSRQFFELADARPLALRSELIHLSYADGGVAGEDEHMFEAGEGDGHRCSFLTNDFLVLLSVARDPDLRVRDVTRVVGITERSTQAILKSLIDEGYLERTRIGRRSHYRVRRRGRLRQPLVTEHTVGTLIDALGQGEAAGPPPPRLVY